MILCHAILAAKARDLTAGLLISALLMTTLAWARPLSASEPPKVLATIRPLHGLVAGVMAEVAAPDLLVTGGQSPHHFTLAPSGARRLQRADVIFVSGQGLMPAIEAAAATLAREAILVDLSRAPGVRLLPRRIIDADARRSSGHDSGHGHEHETEHGQADPHLWLDPFNAKAMVRAISTALSERDPERALAYRTAAAAMLARLDILTAEIERQLRPFRHRPFLVFHDSFQYFESRFQLSGMGAIAPSPETRPGAAHVRDTERRLRQAVRPCLFAEPGAQPRLISMLAERGRANTATLDPLGVNQTAGPEHYFSMIHANAAAIAACFSTP